MGGGGGLIFVIFVTALPVTKFSPPQKVFESGDYFVQHFRRCGNYLRAATNRERRLIERIRYTTLELCRAHTPRAL